MDDPRNPPTASGELVKAIERVDFSKFRVSLIGYGGMGHHYLEALEALGVRQISVVSRSPETLRVLEGRPGLELVSGGLEGFERNPDVDELAIVATPTDTLEELSRQLIELGYRRLLIEKPVSLWSAEIEALVRLVAEKGVAAICAYNRVAYPSLIEVSGRVENEGGATSLSYDFTEIVRSDWEERFPRAELTRWGIANSIHVLSMAHALGGLPSEWSGYRRGALSWHSAGSVFVGGGISERNVPFAYHADWGSKGRWMVEVHTSESAYRLCPLERVFRKVKATGEYAEQVVDTFASKIKPGLAEQVAAMLDAGVAAHVPSMSLDAALRLTRFAEQVFGYPSEATAGNLAVSGH